MAGLDGLDCENDCMTVSVQKNDSKCGVSGLNFSTFVWFISRLQLGKTLQSGPIHPKCRDRGWSTLRCFTILNIYDSILH